MYCIYIYYEIHCHALQNKIKKSSETKLRKGASLVGVSKSSCSKLESISDSLVDRMDRAGRNPLPATNEGLFCIQALRLILLHIHNFTRGKKNSAKNKQRPPKLIAQMLKPPAHHECSWSQFFEFLPAKADGKWHVMKLQLLHVGFACTYRWHQ